MGTIRKNIRETLLKFLDVKKRDRRGSMFGFSNKITHVSYLPDRKKRKMFSSIVYILMMKLLQAQVMIVTYKIHSKTFHLNFFRALIKLQGLFLFV